MQKGVFRKNLCLQWSNRALPGDGGDGLPSSPIFFVSLITLCHLACPFSRFLFPVVVRPHRCGARPGASSLLHSRSRGTEPLCMMKAADCCRLPLRKKLVYAGGYLSMKQLVKDLIHRTVSLWRRILFPVSKRFGTAIALFIDTLAGPEILSAQFPDKPQESTRC